MEDVQPIEDAAETVASEEQAEPTTEETVAVSEDLTEDAAESEVRVSAEDAAEAKRAIEGILFAMGDSVEVEKLAGAVGLSEEAVSAVIDELAREYEDAGRGVRITKLENAYQMCTAPDIYEYLVQVAKQPKKAQLTDVLLETLSIVAYKQPVTKAEIEKIRGVSCGHVISKLIDYKLIEEIGRLDAPGRPMLFGTTEDFLRSFGVTSLEELPVINPVQLEEFKLQAEAEANETLEVTI